MEELLRIARESPLTDLIERNLPASGRLLPYWNGVRQLGAPYLRRHARRSREAGGQFYQYAFTRRELGQHLAAHGFAARGFHPYDPARVLRKALRRLRGGATVSSGPPPAAIPSMPAATRRAPPPALRRAARALLYSRQALRLFGHVLLAVAVRR